MTDGTLDCWGSDTSSPGNVWYGQSSPPAGTYTEVTAGYNHGCALAADESVSCWGSDLTGHEGPGWTGQATPPAGSYVQVVGGGSFSCALDVDDRITCWGDNTYGQLDVP